MTEVERLAEALETTAASKANIYVNCGPLVAAAALIRSQAEELERLRSDITRQMAIANSECNRAERMRGALVDVGVAWDSAPTVAGLLDGRAAKWFFDTLAPAMIAARKTLNEQAARAALGER